MSFANNAATTLAADITSSATTLTVQTGAGSLFPTLTGSQYFYCTLENGSGSSREIVKVTARTTDTFTIVRGQDGTSGTAFSSGNKVELRLVRANLQDFALLDEANTFSQQQTVSSGIKFGDGTVQTTAFVTTGPTGIAGQKFTTSGTFTIPTGVTGIKVTVVGGGGGGGKDVGNGAGGGGGGACGTQYFTGLTPGNTLTVTVGSGGTGGTSNYGGAGGTSSIASGTQTITTLSTVGGSPGFSDVGLNGGGAGGSTVSNGLLFWYGVAGTKGGAACCIGSYGGNGGDSGPFGYWDSMGYGLGGSGGGSSGNGLAGKAGVVIIEC